MPELGQFFIEPHLTFPLFFRRTLFHPKKSKSNSNFSNHFHFLRKPSPVSVSWPLARTELSKGIATEEHPFALHRSPDELSGWLTFSPYWPRRVWAGKGHKLFSFFVELGLEKGRAFIWWLTFFWWEDIQIVEELSIWRLVIRTAVEILANELG